MGLLRLRYLFPMARRLTYLDTASLALKPKFLAAEERRFFSRYSYIPRGLPLNDQFDFIDLARERVSRFLNSKKDLTIFYSGATEALNQLAQMVEPLFKAGDKILLWAYNHSANLIPWLEVAKRREIKVEIVEDLIGSIDKQTRLVALSQESNNLGSPPNLSEIYDECKRVGAFLVNDACQAAASQEVSTTLSDAVVISTNKIYGPTGLGVLTLSERLAINLTPRKFGGGNVVELDKDLNWKSYGPLYKRLEAGTQNLSGIFSLPKLLDLIEGIGLRRIREHLLSLSFFAFDRLSEFKNVRILSERGAKSVIFLVEGWPSSEVVSYLASKNCLLRSGDFCAKYLNKIPGIPDDLIRLSLGIYNNKKDIRRLLRLLRVDNFLNL